MIVIVKFSNYECVQVFSTRIKMQTGRLFCNGALPRVTEPGGIDKFSKMIDTVWLWCGGNAGAGWCVNDISSVQVDDEVCFNFICLCSGWVLLLTSTISFRRSFASESSVLSFWIVLCACSRMLIMAVLRCSVATSLIWISSMFVSTNLVLTSRNSLSKGLIRL